MDLNKYQELSRRTSTLTGKEQLINGVMGLSGESSELLEIGLDLRLLTNTEGRKKFHERNIDELGDCLWYARETADSIERTIKALIDIPIEYEKVYSLNESNLMISINSGKLIDIVKKNQFQGHELEMINFIFHLKAILHYISESARLIGSDLNEIMEHNIEKLKKRYPNGFEAEKSINRGEKCD